MPQRALLIGVDDYDFAPLSSCVNDAVGMRDMLVALKLFAPNECTLMTSPPTPDSVEVPTRKAILAQLLGLYEGQQALDRLLVFFAGHGLSVRLGREADALRTVIVPAKVQQLDNVGDELIDLDELIGRFARRGATQQYWIVDACRNEPPAGTLPNVAMIGWNRPAPNDPRDATQMAQAVLYAVAPLGQARAVQGGHGLVTGHLLDGLACRGAAEWGGAGWYDEAQDTWLIDLKSLAHYARRRMDPTLPSWQRDYFLPQVWMGEKEPKPLRDAGRIADRPFHILIEPPAAADSMAVTLSVKRNPVAAWPPRGNGEAVLLAPELYRVVANLTGNIWLPPQIPDPPVVDLREADRLVLTLRPVQQQQQQQQQQRQQQQHQQQQHQQAEPPALSMAPETGRASIVIERTEPEFVPSADSKFTAEWYRDKQFEVTPEEGRYVLQPPIVTVQAIDPGATVRLTRLTGGNDEREAKPNEPIALSEGLWRIEIRIGNDVIGVEEEDLAAGERYTIAASAQITPALAALLPNPDQAANEAATNPQRTLMPSESIGAMQGAILPTLLPMLALKPLDHMGRILSNFAQNLGIPVVDQKSDAPAAVALAFDGAWPDREVPDLAATSVVVTGGPASRIWRDPSGRISLFLADDVRGDSEGRVLVPEWGQIEAVLPRMPGRCATLSLTLWPDGRSDIAVNLFVLPPGQDQVVRPGRLSRALAIATRLYGTSKTLDDVDYDVFAQLASGSWGDPILGAVAWFGRARWLAADRSMDPGRRTDVANRQKQVGVFLANHAPALSDTRIIVALSAPDPETALDALLNDPGLEQPVLADALSALARHAIARKRLDHWSVARFQRLASDEVFNVIRNPLRNRSRRAG